MTTSIVYVEGAGNLLSPVLPTDIASSAVRELAEVVAAAVVAALGDNQLRDATRLLMDVVVAIAASSVFGGVGGGDAAEVAVLEAVAVALDGDDFGVVDEPVDHGG